jgi:hypothetical protein
MKSWLVLLLAPIVVVGCATTDEIELPPAQCSYVHHEEYPCNTGALEKVFGPLNQSEKRWSCDRHSPHYVDELKICGYLK